MSWKEDAIRLAENGVSWRRIAKKLQVPKSTVSDTLRKHFKGYRKPEDIGVGGEVGDRPIPPKNASKGPRVLVLDIETKFLVLVGWGLFNQNFSLEQVEEDSSIISFSAKWYDEEEVMYMDVTENTEEDLLKALHNLLDEADFVIAHNGRRFDLKKIRARMVVYGMKPYSPVRVIDTLEIVKKEFGFTSNKLSYLTNLLCKNHIKSGHEKFPGIKLWKEFLKGNKEAIDEMRNYNIIDVLSLQELYDVISPWSSTLPNFDIYNVEEFDEDEWEEDGYHYTNLSKFQRYRNKKTGQYRRGRTNLLTKEERQKILANIV